MVEADTRGEAWKKAYKLLEPIVGSTQSDETYKKGGVVKSLVSQRIQRKSSRNGGSSNPRHLEIPGLEEA